jgi:flagellar biosynthesis protein FliR
MYPFEISQYDLYRALLLVFRTGAFLMSIPVFAYVTIPRIVQLWLILALSALIFPTVTIAPEHLPSTTVGFALVILSEVAVGLLMGFAVLALFSAVQFAGHIIGLQMGLAVANIFDPMSAGELSIIGEFYYLVSLIVFLLIDGHHYAINALIRSFDLVPLGGAVFGAGISAYVTSLISMVFILAIKLSAPVVITLFIVNLVLGILSRTVPQMNVFIVGFPLSIGVGLAMIALSLPVFKMVVEKAMLGLQGDFSTVLGMLH